MKTRILLLVAYIFCCFVQPVSSIEIIKNEQEKKVDILIDGKLFTSYLYSSGYEKPVLYPINAPNGTSITRGFPIHPQAGDRVDHPHHVGMWFSHGNVNGLDFWNNSKAIPADKKNLYGTILHKEIISIKQGSWDQGMETAELKTSSEWLDYHNKVLINEKTTYTFGKYEGIWAIMRVTELTANGEKVVFGDTKEGLFALRLCREFEDQKDFPKQLLNANLVITDTVVNNNEIASGVYRNDKGLERENVWGKPCDWISLTGTKNKETISMVMLDNNTNPGSPAHSHARGYGLFAVNNLGAAQYGNYPESKVRLEPQQSITFKHLFIIRTGASFGDEEMNVIADFFNSSF